MDSKQQRKLETYRTKILQFNKDLQDYYQTTGEAELYDVDTTVIGSSSRVEPYKVTDIPEGLLIDMGWIQKEIRLVDGYFTGWDTGMDSIKDCIAYDRRRLNKSWRVWHSNNPDEELEKDEEE